MPQLKPPRKLPASEHTGQMPTELEALVSGDLEPAADTQPVGKESEPAQ